MEKVQHRSRVGLEAPKDFGRDKRSADAIACRGDTRERDIERYGLKQIEIELDHWVMVRRMQAKGLLELDVPPEISHRTV